MTGRAELRLHRPRLTLRRFETLVVASCLVALVVIGPLRAVAAASPLVPFASAMVLLAAPGALLVRWAARDLFGGVALVMHLDLYLSGCGAGARFGPVFRWMQHNIREISVVLAQDDVSVTIPTYSASANVVSFRSAPVLNNLRELESFAGTEIEVPQGSLDVRRFYSRPLVPSEEAEIILRRHKVDYALVSAGSPLDAKLEEMSGLARLDTPGERYALFAVDKSALGS